MEGYEGSVSLVFDTANLPVLQDDSTARVMTNWSATQRDFVILGGDNEEVDRYNLTIDALDVGENREMVQAALVAAGQAID